MNMEALKHQLISMRAQIDAALFLLQEHEPTCKHEVRLNLATLGGPNEWICKDCDFHFKEEE